MCGISGFCNFDQDYFVKKAFWEEVLTQMRKTLSHRGNGNTNTYLNKHIALSHAYLSFRDIEDSTKSILCRQNNKRCAITYSGKIYNTDELITDLKQVGYTLQAPTDDEILLCCYMHYGADFVSRLNGVFAFAIWDEDQETLLLYRDHIGSKPHFYTVKNHTILFASEPKALFAYPEFTPKMNQNSLREILAIGPAHTPGSCVFEDVFEVLPGHYVSFTKDGRKDHSYWDLTSVEHTDSYTATVEKVGFLVRDAIRRQMTSELPVCTFLSGGIDSSIVTAVTAGYMKQQDKILNTFSFDFTENDKYFQSNTFQPERDLPYVNLMLDHVPTNHTYLECDPSSLADMLYTAVDAKDMPGMTDIDASLLYFCSLVAKHNKIALTGECADEIFGGYPWFYRKELLERDGFPWSADISARTIFLDDGLCTELQLLEYSHECYQDSLARVPILPNESEEEKRRRQIGYLSIKWFMQTLLDRMDRTSMYSGLEARVPFADPRIIEYVFNVPWKMKYQNGIEKTLLRDACANLLPSELLHRKKSPYPKTYHPGYEKLLVEKLTAIVNDTNAPISPLINKKKAIHFIASHKELGKPWFGQLMAGPQLMAYFIQINYWMEKYHLSI